MPEAWNTIFSSDEMRRRRAAFSAEMSRNDVRYALVYGANRSGSAVSWLTGWPVTSQALLVARPDAADDVLLVSFFNHVPQARSVCAVAVEYSGPSPVATALGLIAGRARLPGRIGLAGALPLAEYRLLAGQIREVVDLNPAYSGLRLVKSAEEIIAMRRGAALTDAGVEALAGALRPGVTDHELLAAIEHAYVSRAGLHYIHYLGITAMNDPSVAVPQQWPTGRVVAAGDVVTCEISAAAAPEYAGQMLRTFTVGAEATPLYARLHAVAEAAYEALARLLVPGTTAAELAAAGSLIEAAGFRGIDDMVHGFGGGYLPPVVPAPGRSITGPDVRLASGMTLVVQPNVVSADGRAGVQTGELLLVADHGPKRLHEYPRGLRRAG